MKKEEIFSGKTQGKYLSAAKIICFSFLFSIPVAAFAEVNGDEIFIRGLYYSEATGKWITGQIKGAADNGAELGVTLAKQLKDDCERGE